MNKVLSYRGRWVALFAIATLLFASVPVLASADTPFPQTGATLWGPFEAYWSAHGGLAQFGMPRTGVFPTKDGYDAQWFERAEFTYNPKNPDPYKVQLQLLGSEVTANRQGEAPFQRAVAAGTGQYFDVTGHNLSGKLLDFWKATGGLPIYGYPISEAFMEQSKSDGKEYLVQYFERNRLEVHPEMTGNPYQVELGLLGSELMDAQGGPSAFANLGAPLFYPPSGVAQATVTPGPVPAVYPKTGHAPDYSWVAGKVAFTKIQGGCTFVGTGDESFVPQGPGWDALTVNNGDYVVIFGHVAGPDEPRVMCPGGRPYIVDKAQLNP